MAEHPHIKKYSRYLFMVLALMLIITIIENIDFNRPKLHGHHIDCVIDLNGYHSPSMKFSTGFNYELLGKFAKDANCSYSIRLARRREFPLDSLVADSLQIVVVPTTDSVLAGDRFYVSRAFDDSTVWVVPAGNKTLIKEINRWHSHFESSHEYELIKERFTPSYEPFSRAVKGQGYKNASPYDRLFKKHSVSLGWDWRLLAAIVWQESKFHIEVRSSRGAAGLMQMMPSTAAKYNINDILNPDENIEAGVRYLAALEKMFSRYASGIELAKMTLAAYNAGEGRIMDCINMAKSMNMPHSTWDEVKAVIPFMRDSSFMASDSVARLGVFKGHETIAYVDRVMSLYKAFCTIVPGPSSKDQPSKQKEKESAATALSKEKKQDQQKESKQD